MLVKSMRNPEISTLIIDAVVRQYGLEYTRVLGFSYDRASPNISAMQTLAAVYPYSEQLPCVSHTLCHCGEHFFTHSSQNSSYNGVDSFPIAKLAKNRWQRLALSSFPSFSDTRWWSEYKEMVYMLVHREHRETFLFNSFHEEFCDSAYVLCHF